LSSAYEEYRSVYLELSNANDRVRTAVAVVQRLEEITSPDRSRVIRLAFRDVAHGTPLRCGREFAAEIRRQAAETAGWSRQV
jgi:hypothetical protein